jgi:hypothetical protein
MEYCAINIVWLVELVLVRHFFDGGISAEVESNAAVDIVVVVTMAQLLRNVIRPAEDVIQEFFDNGARFVFVCVRDMRWQGVARSK